MKMYFVSNRTITQCERMRAKMDYWTRVELMDKLMESTDNEEGNKILKQIEEIEGKIEKLDNAMNNLVSQGYQLKGYWNDIEIVKQFASERDGLDSMEGIAI